MSEGNITVKEIVKKFITDNKVSCPETLYQSDSVTIAWLELAEDVCNAVGYYEYEDDE